MRLQSSRLRRIPLLVAPLLVAPALAAGPAAAAVPNPVPAAAAWVSTQFVDGTHLPAPDGDHFDSKYGSSYFPNYGENADVLFGLAAAKAGADKAKVALTYLDGHLADYADPSGAFGGPFDGSIAKVALARIVTGTSADDLLHQLKSDECAAPNKTGGKTASKGCTPGAPANIFASASDSFVLLAEARAGGSFAPSPAAVDYFLSLQCANGGFTTGTSACGSGAADIDATSYALMALQALGGHAAEVGKAADWLESQRTAAGYWVSQHIPNTNSTGLAAAALAGAGRDVSVSRTWLRAQAIPRGKPGAGSLKYNGTFTPSTTSATSANVLATAQGILGLVDNGSLATLSAAGSSAGVVVQEPVTRLSATSGAPGTTFHVTAIGFAAGGSVRAYLALTQQAPVGHGIVDPSGIVSIAVTVPADASARADTLILTGGSGLETKDRFTIVAGVPPTTPPTTSGPPPLADTGTDSGSLTSIGLAALLAGAGVLLVARRRRHGRHAA